MLKLQITFIILLVSTFLSAQNADPKQQLAVFKTTTFESYVGHINDENADSISINTFNGNTIELEKSDILVTYNFDGRIRNGKLQREDPNSSFYLYSPSAFAIDNGKLFCRDFCLFFPSVNYGLGNILSAQAGLFWYPGMDYQNTPYVGNIKLTAFETSIFSLAGGLTYVNLPVIQKERIYSTGFAFLTGTIGNRYNHASISTGWGYIQKKSEWNREDKPIVVAAANVRLLNFVSFVTENWFFPDENIEDALITTVIRLFGRQAAIDLGATFTINSIKEKISPIPVINITYHLR